MIDRKTYDILKELFGTVARCGWTQRDLNFLPPAENANQVLSPAP